MQLVGGCGGGLCCCPLRSCSPLTMHGLPATVFFRPPRPIHPLTEGPQSRVQPSRMGISTTSTLGASVKKDRASSAS